jgi:hypothetical protein
MTHKINALCSGRIKGEAVAEFTASMITPLRSIDCAGTHEAQIWKL